LNLAAGILSVDHERRVRSVRSLSVQRHASLSADLIEKSRNAPVKTGVFLASTDGRKRLIDDKLARSNLKLRGYGHKVE
jgi:hypothetical protein